MKLSECRYDGQLLIRMDGRLDATWADYFKDTLLKRVRGGEHQLILDAAGLSFLSSLGIRSLMVLYKELASVQGSFQIIHASGMVRETLEHSGLGQWLSDLTIEDVDSDVSEAADAASASEVFERFELNPTATLTAERIHAWTPWTPVAREKTKTVRFEPDRFGLGIGGAGSDYDSAKEYFGEFVSMGGHVAVQPPDERGRPDCILSEQEFVPSLECIEGLICRGEMSHLVRFRSSDETPCTSLSNLVRELIESCTADAVGFAVIGEIEGLVGAHLIQSPGALTADTQVVYPEVKEWLSFTGERVFAREQALIAGVARVSDGSIVLHAHAAVFPYQLLPNGCIDLRETATRLFSGPPPKTVLHLANDQRSGNGVGESALFSGACWGAPIDNSEVLS